MTTHNAHAYDVVVVGAGPAGVTAALRARELGASVALIERGQLGGTCTNDGCVPTRVLARTARLLRDSRDFGIYGLIGECPQVDLEAVLSRAQEVVYTVHEKKQLISHLTETGVALILDAGSASFVDPHTLRLGSGEFSVRGERFIVCVGGHARRLDFPGAELAMTHSDVWTLKKLPRRMAIVGAAATGCQVASIFEAFGTDVTLLEIAPRILPGEDESVSRVMKHAFRRRLMHVVNGLKGVDRIEKTDDGLRLIYRREEREHALDTDAVLMAVGWPGNLEALNLGAAGVETARGYITVNDFLQTTAPHIYAAGDVTGRMMLVQSAGYDARAAAENALLDRDEPHRHQIVPHGGFTDPEYGSVGLTEAQAREREDVLVSTAAYAEMDRAVIDGRTDGMCKLIVSASTRRILGAHVVGEQALEIIHLVAAGMAAGMTLEQLAELEIAYPTYTAILGLAARRIVRDVGAVPLSPQWRALGPAPVAEWERLDE